MANDTEITKVRIVIRHLLWQIREVRKDKDAAWQWVNRFANTLEFQDLETDPDQYALAILSEARSFNDQQRRKGQMLGVRKQLAKEGIDNPTQEQLDEKWLEMYGNETTADAPTREDVEFKSDSGDAGNLESATSAKNSVNDGCSRQNRRGGEGSLRLGGHVTPSRTCRPPRDFEEVKDFIAQNGLDYDDARLWWERNYVERDGIDKDGKPIKNWKGALVNACKAEETKRRSA